MQATVTTLQQTADEGEQLRPSQPFWLKRLGSSPAFRHFSPQQGAYFAVSAAAPAGSDLWFGVGYIVAVSFGDPHGVESWSGFCDPMTATMDRQEAQSASKR